VTVGAGGALPSGVVSFPPFVFFAALVGMMSMVKCTEGAAGEDERKTVTRDGEGRKQRPSGPGSLTFESVSVIVDRHPS
jgi:hypothetical protein